jgi:hypothetical protein
VALFEDAVPLAVAATDVTAPVSRLVGTAPLAASASNRPGTCRTATAGSLDLSPVDRGPLLSLMSWLVRE